MARNRESLEPPRACPVCKKTTMIEWGHDYDLWCDDGRKPEPHTWQCLNCGRLLSRNRASGSIDYSEPRRITLAPGEYENLVSYPTRTEAVRGAAGMDQVEGEP